MNHVFSGSPNSRSGNALLVGLAGGGMSLILVSMGLALVGLSIWVLSTLTSLWLWNTSRHNVEAEKAPDSVRALLSMHTIEDGASRRLETEIRELIDTVGTQGHSIRDVVRYLQEHATLVAWLVDNLDRAAKEVRGHLDQMRINAEKVSERGSQVLEGSRKGMEFVSSIGQSTETLFQDAESLSRSVQSANAAVSQIQSSLGTIEGGIDKLSRASDHSTKFVAQVAGTMGTIRERMHQSLELFEQVAAYTRRGRDVVDTSGRGVEEIRRSSESTMQRIEELSRKSRQIEQVLGIITEVADETNLLSLNAAILAAQAGERGAAFAVVADQIRNLAHRTQDSIRHIEGIIREVQENIRETNLRMSQSLEAVRQGETYGREAVEQLSLIEQAVTESVEQAREIAAAAEQQHGTAGEMVSISGEVNKDIHSILSHLQQSTKEMGGIRSLVQQVSVLSDSVRTSARTNHQSALDVSILMGSFVNQMEEIDSLVEGERNDIKALDQAMGPVGESAEATNESLETIHKIVTELVHHADNLQDEVERHLPLKTDDEEKGPGEGEPAALESGMVPA